MWLLFNSSAIDPTCDLSVVSEPGLLKFDVKLDGNSGRKLQIFLHFRYRHGSYCRGAPEVFLNMFIR